jgi:hypothetical protein
LSKHFGQQRTAAVLIDLTALLQAEPVDVQVLQQALALGWGISRFLALFG